MNASDRLVWLQQNATRIKLQAGASNICLNPWSDRFYVDDVEGGFATLGEAIDAAASKLGGIRP